MPGGDRVAQRGEQRAAAIDGVQVRDADLPHRRVVEAAAASGVDGAAGLGVGLPQCRAAVVGPAAQVAGEAIARLHPDLVHRQPGRKGEPAPVRVKRHRARRRRGQRDLAGQRAKVDGLAPKLDRRRLALQADEQAQHRVVGGHEARGRRRDAVTKALQLGVQRQAAQRAGHVVLLGQVGDRRLGARAVEQRRVQAGRVHGPPGPVVARAGEVGGLVAERAGTQRVAAQPPEEQADMRDVEPPGAGRDAAHLRRVRAGVERAVGQLGGRGVAHGGGGRRRVAHVVHVLRRRQALEELDRARRPAGDVARQLLQHHRRALAAAVCDGVGDEGARADAGRRHRPDRPYAQQVAQVGHDPLVAGLDEPVVVEAADVGFDAFQLGLDDAQQRAQRLALVGVAQAVYRR